MTAELLIKSASDTDSCNGYLKGRNKHHAKSRFEPWGGVSQKHMSQHNKKMAKVVIMKSPSQFNELVYQDGFG